MPSSAPLVADRFRSLFVIGRGGMGWVEVALEQGERGFQRIVALKRMLPEASIDRHHIDMFMREAHVAELLSHPNVVHAFAFGEDKGELFLAMEYVEGEPLSRMLATAHKQEGRIAAPLVAHFLAEVCEGLHAAHELCDPTGKPLNLIHRDVSPHNVMVAYEGHVKLLDFGVVKIDQLDAKGGSGGRTKTGEVKGKTAYMSPEQAMGEPLDRRSDLYSLGAVLFECIAGQRMWGTGTDFDVLRRLALEEPPRLADVAPNAPRALCALHARLVARNRDERPPTALAVASELRTFIADSGTRPDAHVVRAVMGRLFQQEIERHQQALARALEEAAPGEVEDLRRSLVTGFSETRIEIPGPVAEARPVVVRARGMISTPAPEEATQDTLVDADPSSAWRSEPAPEVALPMQRPRVVPWAIGAAALLVLGSVAFLRWGPTQSTTTPASQATATSAPSAAASVASTSASPGQPASARSARTDGAGGSGPSEPAASRDQPPPAQPKPPRIGTRAPSQGPPVSPRPARSAVPSGPSPLPLDEHPI
jgi:serine/threonine protein kinase